MRRQKEKENEVKQDWKNTWNGWGCVTGVYSYVRRERDGTKVELKSGKRKWEQKKGD